MTGEATRSGRAPGRRMSVAVLLATALVLAACGDDDDTTASTTTSEVSEETTTTTEADDPPPDDITPDDVPDDEADDGPAPASDSPPATLREITPDDVAAARAIWADYAGRTYEWGYFEQAEGMTADYCVQGAADDLDYRRDVPACPPVPESESLSDGRTVDDWFAWFDDVFPTLDDFISPRIIEAAFDPATGHPTEMVVYGGEVDGFAMETTVFSFVFQAEFEACNEGDGDPESCYILGDFGEPPPPSFEGDGNSYSQAPDDALVNDCNAGDAHACYWAGVRGLEVDGF